VLSFFVSFSIFSLLCFLCLSSFAHAQVFLKGWKGNTAEASWEQFDESKYSEIQKVFSKTFHSLSASSYTQVILVLG
jgi:hypothetical protein